MKVVQAMLRHASESTTSQFYTTVLAEVARAAAEKVALIIPRTSPGPLGLPRARIRPQWTAQRIMWDRQK
jgi:hypothetical protein